MKLKIVEIFEGIQGEGHRTGHSSIFIRLAGCNKNCWFCDTEWGHYEEYTLTELCKKLEQYKSDWIVWTGGEPTLQLTKDIIHHFTMVGYYQAIETNGTNPVPDGLDYVACSPKVEAGELKLVFKDHEVDEFRFIVPFQNDLLPPDIKTLPKAKHYFISPIFTGFPKERTILDPTGLAACLRHIKENPEWKLSVQIHKLLNIK